MNILYEDNHILVCRKEAGMPVQSASVRVKDMVSELKTYLREKDPAGRQPYLAVVHRLDQGVSGILVFAKNPKAAAGLSAQLTDGRMNKQYLALVHICDEQHAPALLDGQQHRLTDWLKKDTRTNTSSVVPEGGKEAKKAELILQRIDGGDDDAARADMTEQKDGSRSAYTALLRIRLLTGRHHQIRVQLSYAGMPIIGDRKYGKEEKNDMHPYPCLCADSLSFTHPLTGKRMTWTLDKQEIPFLGKHTNR